jgi:glycosyltransferase involved in cell wall biosynthesis
MKILHFFKTYYPLAYGGVQQVIYQLAEGAVKSGSYVDVLSLSPSAFESNRIGSHFSHYSKQNFYVASTGFSISSIGDFKKLAENADVIHYHFPWPFMDMVHFLADLNKPTVVSYHSDIVKQKWLLQFYKPLMKRFLSDVDVVVASSPNYCESSSILSGLLKKPEVIPFGLDETSYPIVSASKIEYWRSIVGNKFFLFVGFLRYYKGLSFLLDALVGLDYPLVIVGEGPCERDLKQQAETLKLKNIYFVGAISDEDKCTLYELCYSVVFPSHLRSEAYGMTLLESSMYGKPMISCEIGTGTTFINLHGETGIAVSPANSSSLRTAIVCIWSDPIKANEMGRNARIRFEKYFTAEKMVGSYMKIYNRVIDEHKI